MPVATISPKSRLALLLLLTTLAVACSREQSQPAAATAEAAGTSAAAAPPPAVSAQVQSMDIEQLRDAANKALGENRIYAPGGDNAVEYYLALRDKLPSDPTVTSALTDLMPYTVIAAEQSIGREDLVEAQRLTALIEKADAKAPALPRLKQSVASAQATAAKRTETEAARAEERTRQLEQQRLAQQAEQQRQAAAALAEQQAQQQRAQQEQEAARAAAAQREAAARAAPAAPAASTPEPPQPPPASPPPAPAAASELRVVSAPSPRYPAEALRAGTSGEVLVELTVGTDGSVTSARVVRSTPVRVFDREAVNAVRRWKFAPVDAPTTTRRTISFRPN